MVKLAVETRCLPSSFRMVIVVIAGISVTPSSLVTRLTVDCRSSSSSKKRSLMMEMLILWTVTDLLKVRLTTLIVKSASGPVAGGVR